MSTLTLTGGKGLELTLFDPAPCAGGMEAHAFYLTAPILRRRTLKDKTSNKRFQVPALPDEGFFPVRLILKEVK